MIGFCQVAWKSVTVTYPAPQKQRLNKKVLWMAENLTGVFHSVYTLRGALAWSKYINDALYRFGKEVEVMLASHHWPRSGNERVQEVLKGQRDLYANMNNQVLHFANQGLTINSYCRDLVSAFKRLLFASPTM
jgi:alkyl sulfatase BDS1-like metallo-beta-lactamase superfamily hydrolase